MDRLLKTFFAIRQRVRAWLKKTCTAHLPAPDRLFLKEAKTCLPFITGVNLPWLSYGGDFGANAWSPDGGVARPANREALQRIFRALPGRRPQTVRWFLFCDGRSGIRFSARGTPIGPDPHLFRDIDAALEVAVECKLSIVFVLFDFLWSGGAAMVNGVQVRGRGKTIGGHYQQAALRRRVLKPLLRRYGASPIILAWDIINEPEWATRGCGATSANAIPFRVMRRFIKRVVRLIHRHTQQLATVGLGNAAGLPLVIDSGLDFYQVHWYDRWDSKAPLDKPVSGWNLDRPLLLGEYPTRNSARQPEAIIAAAEKSGYCGALAWSLLGKDRFSGLS